VAKMGFKTGTGMNPIEHVWDFIGRKIHQRNPKCQNINELRTAILQEWQQFPQERLTFLAASQAMELSEQPLAVKYVVQFRLYVA
jgi:hypothetical protein